MLPETLLEIDRELRSAAAARLYDDVERLCADFCRIAAQYAASLPPGDPRLRRLAGQVDETLSWSILMMQAARASCSSQLRRAQVAQSYMAANRPS